MANKINEYKIRNFGPLSKRRDYSNTKNQLEMQDFLVMQKDSYNLFLKKGIEETLKEIFPIVSSNNKIEIDYIANSKRLDKPKDSLKTIAECRKKGKTYAAKLYIKLRKTVVETGEVAEDEILFGFIPLITPGSSFIINGSEKVIVSQLIRSAGAYFGLKVRNKQSDDLFNKLEILPRLGSWFEMFHKVTSNNVDSVKIKIDKTKSITLAIFLRALGFEKETIFEYFGDSEVLQQSFKKEKYTTKDECRQVIYQIIRKGDRITQESLQVLFYNLFFNKRRYNLSPTGRYVLNRKLKVSDRLIGNVLFEDLIAQKTNENYKKGDVIFKKGHTFNIHDVLLIDKLYEDEILLYETIKDFEDIANPETSIYGKFLLENNPKYKKRNKIAIIKVQSKHDDNKPVLIIGNDSRTEETTLVLSDFVAAISYYFNLLEGIGMDDDPDSLINKKVVLVGELVQNQFKIALIKVEKTTKEKISLKEIEKITPKSVINNKPIYNQFKTFFNSSKLSQFMDQTNPLSEISNKRRITSLGPGGLNRDTAQFEVRDVHPTHYGKICPIETPEGPNIGLILNLATYARINELGFLETPYFKVNNGVVDYSKPVYLDAISEKGFAFAQSFIDINDKNEIVDKLITVRKNQNFLIASPKEIDFIDVSSKQMISIAASAVPFLENNDANRALMGSNMQRQAVPLLFADSPIVGTGIEANIAKYSSSNLRAKSNGEIIFVDSKKIKIQDNDSDKIRVYNLKAYNRSNQGTLLKQQSLYSVGKKVKEGDLLTDSSSFKDGELALGKNVLVGFSTWNGYNYEDAIILNEKLVKEDVFTSIHIEEQTIQFRRAKNRDDELTREIPNASAASKKFLDENGIVVVGSEVSGGDILVGRITPKGEYNPTPEEKLMTVIFGQRDSSYLDTSLKVKHGQGGTVIGVEVLSRENGDSLEDGIDKLIKVSIAQKRKIKVGDKMAGRHGNKGVVSIVLPEEDMPHLEDGTPLDILLNPQGVPSRMNLGQVLELHLGFVGKKLGEKFVTPSFDGIKKEQIKELLKEANLPENGKLKLINPIDGETIDNDVAVGIMYMMKLSHMVDDKMHARSVGPYSLITQQPLGGKSQNGGQRFGEMETWALESYGAANILQELLTYKSDNISGRNKLYNSLSTGDALPTPGTPESFNVLAYELRGLGIKLEVHENENLEDKEIK